MKKCLIFCLMLLVPWTIWGNSAIQVSEWTATDPELPTAFDGFRIAQISDLHNAQFGDENRELLSLLAQAEPDAIVLTGDLVDSCRPEFDTAVNFAAQAVAIAPCYYVPGNHESRLNYSALRDRLRAVGVTVLEEQAVTLHRGTERIRILGLRDPDFFQEEEADVLDSLTTETGFEILLAHRPEKLPRYSQTGVDLVFSGHAHGGQIRLPLLGGLFAPGQGLFPQYDSGLYYEGQTAMLVSRGLGNSIFPFRFNNRPEILVCTLRAEA